MKNNIFFNKPSISLDEAPVEEASSGGIDWMLIALIIAAIVIAILIVVVVIIIIKGKKAKLSNKSGNSNKKDLLDRKEPDTKKDIKDQDNSSSNYYYKKQSDVPPTTMLWSTVVRLTDKVTSESYIYEFDSSKDYGEAIIGRGEKIDVDIKIAFPNISNRHCLIIKQGKLFFIRDLNSTNGTFYNGHRLYEKTPLSEHGELSLGSRKFNVDIEGYGI